MRVNRSPDMRVYARSLAARKLRVFPLFSLNADGRCACGNTRCNSPGKHPLGPLVPHGLHDATLDLATIDQWWFTWPDANIGIQTGAPNAIVVLDVDRAGWRSVVALEREHGPLPVTPTAETGGCGAHLYFAHPGGMMPNSTGRIALGIDLRGDGGYVVAPPSKHRSGTHYRWADGQSLFEVPVAPMPTWLRQSRDQRTTHRDQVQLTEDEVVTEGGRNDRLMRIGSAIRRYGMTECEIAAALHVINARRCQPPLSAEEVDKIAASVSRYHPAPSPRAIVRPTPRFGFEFRHGQVVPR